MLIFDTQNRKLGTHKVKNKHYLSYINIDCYSVWSYEMLHIKTKLITI
jgi:hypothetical protein